jgi:hypothetical protein
MLTDEECYLLSTAEICDTFDESISIARTIHAFYCIEDESIECETVEIAIREFLLKTRGATSGRSSLHGSLQKCKKPLKFSEFLNVSALVDQGCEFANQRNEPIDSPGRSNGYSCSSHCHSVMNGFVRRARCARFSSQSRNFRLENNDERLSNHDCSQMTFFASPENGTQGGTQEFLHVFEMWEHIRNRLHEHLIDEVALWTSFKNYCTDK